MIISDKCQFAFIHIPKCAGTSIRKQLVEIDDRCGKYARIKDKHSDSPIDYYHLTMDALANLEPHDFSCIEQYHTTCMVRDPIARFGAAVSEYAKQVVRCDLSLIREDGKMRIIENIVDQLSICRDKILPYNLIWFQPQKDFIFHNDKRIVKHVFDISQIEALGEYIRSNTSVDIDVSRRDNPSLTVTGRGTKMLIRNGRGLKNVLPKVIYGGLRRTGRSVFLKPSTQKTSGLELPSDVLNFVKTFYQEDFDLLGCKDARDHCNGL